MEVPSSRGQDRSRGHHAGVSRGPGGAVRRRGTPIPVLPPRVPTPVPSADSRGSNSTHLEPEPPPPPPPVSQQRDIAHLATRYLEDNVKAWINPRIYAKLDHEAITSPDYVFKTRATNNHHHYHQPHNKHHQSKSQRGSKEDPKNSYLGNGTTEEHDAVGEIHRSPTAALLSSNGQQNGCGETRTVSGSRPGTRDGSSSGVVIKHHHNHHHGGDMSGKHVVSPADSTSRNTHQSAVVFNGKQSTTMLTNSYQQKACVKNSVVNPTINANGVAVSNGNSSAMPQTKISNKGSASQRMLSPGDEVGGYGRHQPPKPSPRSHHYTGHSSVVDFLYGGLDGLSTSPTLVLTPGMGAGTPSSSYYSESKYAYSVSGVPGTPAQSSAAAAFFARAAQKLNLTSSPHRRKRHSSGEDDGGTGFSAALRRAPPPVPPALLRRIGVKEVTGVGKVKVMLRVCGPSGAGAASATASTPDAPAPAPASFFSVDSRKKQVTLFDPAACGGTAAPEDRRVGVAAPKMFAFDAIFTQDDSQTEVCSSALTDVIHAVINGTDGCLFCFGHARLGKTYTMVGSPDAAGSLGVIPCAISWLFRGINEQKQKTGARFSVRVSAVEVQQTGGGAAQQLKDLLAGHANDCEQSPGVYLRDDPLFGTQLQNQSELRVPSAERAAFYLDAAVGGRSGDSHLLYTLHVYQYSVAGKGHGVAGGRSRLHLIDLGSCERGKASGGIPLSGLGNVLLAIFNGQKHLPHREHKITQLLKECLSSLTCHAAMIAHVSPAAQHYTDTLATVQLASRIHRMRRRKIKFGGGSAGSGGSSGEEASAGAGRLQENGRSTGSSDVDPSSSEQSADTVIYVGPSDDAATDGEHPPVYIPSLNSGDNRCAMGKALRGSGAEHRPPSKGTQASPVHRPAASKSASPSKASPARTPSKTAPHKTPAVDAGKTSVPSGSDEQWIDGPRISRSKVAEARSLLKKKETWVDGPLLPSTAATTTTAAAGTGQGAGTGSGSGSYGFMDSHKKSMIRRWVENQTVQIQRQAAKHTTRPPATGAPPGHTYKELTVFKTCDEDGEPKALDDTDTPAQETPEQRQESRPQSEQGEEEEEEEGVCDIPPPLQLLQPHNNEISIDVTVDSLDVRLRILQERRDATGVGGDDEVEIIEVEEPCEPVPMQDSCLQVTEEDIALCMGELENPLPEVDQESDEHPLRVLSQENLTVVSTFTDSMSVVTDLERMLPRRPFGPPDPRPYSLYDDYLRQREADKFEQLARLHEMYKTKLARANATKTFGPSLPYRPPSRCQSLSMSDMLYGTGTGIGAGTGTGSIYSEPAYNPHQNQAKICDNCKMSFGRSWYQPLLTRELPATLCDSVNHRFCRSGCNLSSLRHPDGASNPNLKEEVERVPGNGASTSDHEDETSEQRSKSRQTVQEEVRTVTGQAHDEDEEDEAPPVLPPALPPAPASTRLHRRLFGGKTRPQHPAMAPEGYDSGHDSGSPRYDEQTR